MAIINKRILENFKDFSDKNPDFPKNMLKLLDQLLDTVNRDNVKKDVIDKLYDQIAEQYVGNKELVEWCKKYA